MTPLPGGVFTIVVFDHNGNQISCGYSEEMPALKPKSHLDRLLRSKIQVSTSIKEWVDKQGIDHTLLGPSLTDLTKNIYNIFLLETKDRVTTYLRKIAGRIIGEMRNGGILEREDLYREMENKVPFELLRRLSAKQSKAKSAREWVFG